MRHWQNQFSGHFFETMNPFHDNDVSNVRSFALFFDENGSIKRANSLLILLSSLVLIALLYGFYYVFTYNCCPKKSSKRSEEKEYQKRLVQESFLKGVNFYKNKKKKTRQRHNVNRYHNFSHNNKTFQQEHQQHKHEDQLSLFSQSWKQLCEIFVNRSRGKEQKEACTNGYKSKVKRENKNDHHGEKNVLFVGLDCEMVGTGRRGLESMLARCTLVTLQNICDKEGSIDGESDSIRVLYDKYVLPRKRVTDYRTQYSGITPAHFSSSNASNLVTFEECRIHVMKLLYGCNQDDINTNNDTNIEESINHNHQIVVLVGHGLENDFDVLNLEYPTQWIRDTASYPPLMRPVKKGFHPQKLSYLTRTYLHRDIQQGQTSSSSSSSSSSEAPVGHDSVEDAAAALQLYWKFSNEWESSLGHPLKTNINAIIEPPQWTLYLDGCNLPMGLRQSTETLEEPQLIEDSEIKPSISSQNTLDNSCVDNDDKPPSSFLLTWQLTSKITSQSHNNSNDSTPSRIDWIPLFQSILSSSSNNTSKDINSEYSIFQCIQEIIIMWDGASFLPKYKRQNKNKNKSEQIKNQESKEMISPRLYIHVSDPKTEVDDLLIDILSKKQNHYNKSSSNMNHAQKQFISIDKVIKILSYGLATDSNGNKTCWNIPTSHYVVVKRCGGGTKTNKKLFDKLNLRRPEEGALCLLPCLSARFQKDCLQIARELKRNVKSNILQYEIYPLRSIHSIVITDDVLLANRVIENEGSVVLSYRQYQHLF